MENLVVLNNEKVSKKNNKFFSRNYNFKILPEGLSKYFNVEYIVRKSNLEESHELTLDKIKIASNIIQFIFFVISTFKNKNTKYYIICITPYTFIAFLFLFIFKKKVYVYLISSGHEEWESLLGTWSVWIYDIMFKIVTNNSIVIALHHRLYEKKNNFHVINSSSLGDKWFSNFKEAKIDKVKFLYVARINPVKGINEFLKMFKNLDFGAELSIIGKTNNLKHRKEFQTIIKNSNNIHFIGYISNRQDLINTYDNHNILVLPSYTEGQPYVVDEALVRKRPVLIFDDIKHIIRGRKGIFVSKRDSISFLNTTNYIMNNYKQIQKDIEENNFTLEKDMFKEISDVVKNN